MRTIEREELFPAIDLPQALARVEQSFRLHSDGLVTAASIAHLGFSDPPGDCHIKAAHIHGQPTFVVKISNGFYQNASRGLPSSDGLVLIFSADTGVPLALLADRGLITDMRTALAGVVATSLARPAGPGIVGVVGTGTQARLQLEFLHRLKGPVQSAVWGRSQGAVDAYLLDMEAHGIQVQSCATLVELCNRCDTLITATPSTHPLIHSAWVRPGTHITAVGADAQGKQELDPALFRRARGVLVDSRSQCIEHGEISHAIAAGTLGADLLVEIGMALGGQEWQLNPAGDVTIADLTGLAASDATLAQAAWSALTRDSRPRP